MKKLYILCIVLATLLPIVSAKTYYIINASNVTSNRINQDYAVNTYISDIQQKDSNADIVVVDSIDEFGNLITTLKNDPSSAKESVIINTYGETVPFPESYDIDNEGDIDRSESMMLFEDIREAVENGATWVNPAGYSFYYVSNHNLYSDDDGDGAKWIGWEGANTVIGKDVSFQPDADANNWTNPSNSSDWFSTGKFNRPLNISEINSLNGTMLYNDSNEAISADIPIGNGSFVFGGIDGNNKSQLDKIISRMDNYIINKEADNPTAPVRTPIPVFAIILTVLLLPALLYRHYN
jgi:hypothetical protein